jgi:hypothetical protein
MSCMMGSNCVPVYSARSLCAPAAPCQCDARFQAASDAAISPPAVQIVSELMREQDSGVTSEDFGRATARPLPAPHPAPSMPVPVGSSSMPIGSAGRPMMIMASPSFHASHSMAASSYHEALASSLRAHGFMGPAASFDGTQ